MDSWHATILGLRQLPRAITAFEIQVFSSSRPASPGSAPAPSPTVPALMLRASLGFDAENGRSAYGREHVQKKEACRSNCSAPGLCDTRSRDDTAGAAVGATGGYLV